MKKSNLLVSLLFTLILGCQIPETNQEDVVIAEAAGKVLLYSQIKYNYPIEHLNSQDSIEMINDYVTKWIKQELLVSEAEKNLTDEELNIENELEKYRQELLIHKYKTKQINKLVEQKIPYTDIENYYNNHQNIFVLDHSIVRVKYLIFPQEVKIKSSFKKNLDSKNERIIAENEDFIFKYAKKYDDFNKNWIYFENLIQEIDYNIKDWDKFLSKNNIIEFNSNNEFHLILIEDYLLSGNQAPIDFVSPQIRSLIINDKKLDFLREIKDSLYNNALKYNKFRVFN